MKYPLWSSSPIAKTTGMLTEWSTNKSKLLQQNQPNKQNNTKCKHTSLILFIFTVYAQHNCVIKNVFIRY
jgi:hypothetical protein